MVAHSTISKSASYSPCFAGLLEKPSACRDWWRNHLWDFEPSQNLVSLADSSLSLLKFLRQTFWQVKQVYHLKPFAELKKQLKKNFSGSLYPSLSAMRGNLFCAETWAPELQQLRGCFWHLGMQEMEVTLKEINRRPLPCAKWPWQWLFSLSSWCEGWYHWEATSFHARDCYHCLS